MRNKFLQGITSFAIASAVCLAFGAVTASAAPLATSDNIADKVKVNYADQTITVNTDNLQVLFGVSSVARNGVIKTPAWEVYDVKEGSVKIDISSLNTQKDNYVQIKGNSSSDPITVCIPASDKKLKVAYDVSADKVAGTTDATKDYALQYRTQYSDWRDYDADVKLSIYQQRGATLYFRQATSGVEDDGSVALTAGIAGEAEKITTAAGDEITEDIYNLPALPGKELKVAIAKKANGPKITVDYLKNEVKIPKNAMYRVNSADELTAEFEAASTDVVTLSADDMKTLFTAGSSVEAKTAAKGKKAESKVSQVLVTEEKGQTVLVEGDAPESAKIGWAPAEAAAADDEEATAADVTITTKAVKNQKTGKVTKYEMTVVNSSDYKYEVYLGSTTETPKVGVKGAKAIAAKKKTGDTTVKINIKPDDITSKAVYIHRVGDKSGVWATDYILVGNEDNKGLITKVEDGLATADQKNLQAVADSLTEGVITAYTYVKNKANTEVPLNNSISFNQKGDYTVTVDEKEVEVKDVTVKVTKVSGDTTNFKAENGVLKQTNATFSGNATPITVTLSFEKSGCTAVPKTVEITISK